MILEHKTIDLFDKLLIEKAKAVPPLVLPNIMHNEACFMYVIEGKCTAISATESLVADPPDAILMKCGNFLNFCVPDDEHPHYQAIAVHFHPDVLRKVYENQLPSFLTKSTDSKQTITRVPSTELIEKFIESISFYFDHPELVSEDLLVLKVKELLLLLSQTDRGTQVRDILGSLFSPVSFKLKQIVESHIFKDISVTELALLCSMSESSFKREFKKEYNDSPASYIKGRKLQRSHDLLNIGQLTVADVAYDCGFNDLAHFSKSYKEKFGYSPSQTKMNE